MRQTALPPPRPAAADSVQGHQIMRWFAYAFLLVALAVFSGLVQKFGGRQFTLGTIGQIVTLASYGCLVLAGICVGVRRADLTWLLAFWSPMIALIFLSVLWSTHPGDTLLKAVSWSLLLVGMTVFVSARLDNAFERALGLLAIIAGWGSLVASIVTPSLTYAFVNNMYVGLFVHKSFLADTSSLGGLLALHLALERRSKMWAFIFVGCVIGVLSAETWSAIFAFGLGVFLLTMRRFGRVVLIGSFTLALLLPVITPFLSTNLIVDMLGRDVTLSGRTYLWDFAYQLSRDNWILGTGFKNIGSIAAWDDHMIMLFLGDQIVANHTHNLWVETFYMAGLLGVVGLTVYVLVVPLRAFRPGLRHHWLYIALLTYFMFTAALKVPLFNATIASIVTVYVIAAFALEGRRDRARMRRPAAPPATGPLTLPITGRS